MKIQAQSEVFFSLFFYLFGDLLPKGENMKGGGYNNKNLQLTPKSYMLFQPVDLLEQLGVHATSSGADSSLGCEL
jgi:hypothetical protein